MNVRCPWISWKALHKENILLLLFYVTKQEVLQYQNNLVGVGDTSVHANQSLTRCGADMLSDEVDGRIYNVESSVLVNMLTCGLCCHGSGLNTCGVNSRSQANMCLRNPSDAHHVMGMFRLCLGRLWHQTFVASVVSLHACETSPYDFSEQ